MRLIYIKESTFFSKFWGGGGEYPAPCLSLILPWQIRWYKR